MFKIRGLLVVSFPLLLATACTDTVEEDGADSADITLGPNCVIKRPYAWHANSGGVGATCFEGVRRQDLTLPPGGSETFVGNTGFSHGEVTVVCHANGDGLWDDTFKSCFPGRGGEP